MLKYLRKKATVLLNPDGTLYECMPSDTISSVNNEVKDLVNAMPSDSRKQRPYQNYTVEERARTGKRAAEFGIMHTARNFSKQFPDRPLKESTVRTWMTNNRKELANRDKAEGSLTFEKLEMKKRGNPYLLGEEMDRQLQEYIKSLSKAKAVISSAIVISATAEIVKSHDNNLLESIAGHIKCTKHWAKHFLNRF